MLTAVLIDDEPLALKRLEKLILGLENKIEIVGKALNGVEGAEIVNRLGPDLIFLDVQMPGLNGFEMLNKLHCSPWVVFCTAYDEYALEAFQVNSIDYLLKPISPERLASAVNKLKLFENKILKGDEIINTLRAFWDNKPDVFKLKMKDRILFLKHEEILCLNCLDKYVEVVTINDRYLINDTLNRLENVLPGRLFCRIHRSVIVNRDYVSEVIKFGANSYKVKLRGMEKELLPLSRDLKDRL